MSAWRATVSSTAPLAVVLDGSASPVPAQALDGYAPAVDDRVVVAPFMRSQLLVLGKLPS